MPADVTRDRPGMVTTEAGAEPFVGRRSSIQALKTWFSEHDSGVLAVLGAAGTGKSALLRQLSPATPHPQLGGAARTVTAWIDARDLVLAELHDHLTEAVGADLRDRHVVKAAIGELHPTVVIDGLDEMAPGEPLATAVWLRDLAECGFRIVVALRTDPETPAESGRVRSGCWSRPPSSRSTVPPCRRKTTGTSRNCVSNVLARCCRRRSLSRRARRPGREGRTSCGPRRARRRSCWGSTRHGRARRRSPGRAGRRCA